MQHKESILGVYADVITLTGALQKSHRLLQQEGPSLIASVNPEIIMEALSSKELYQCLNSSDLALPDGVGIVLTSLLRGGGIRERVTGIDLMEKLLELSAREGYRVFFLGSPQGVAENAAVQACSQFPNLEIAGTHHGYFSPGEEGEVADKVAACKTDILFIGMGVKRQERFMFNYASRTGARLLMVIGGSLEVLSGLKKRAPRWVRRLGAEWFYRTLQEPRRFRRIFILPRFLFWALLFKEDRRFKLLGVPVDVVTYESTLERARERIKNRSPLWVVAINPEKIVRSLEDRELHGLLAQSGLAIPDGIGVLWAGWLMGYRLTQRVTGVDLFLRLIEEAAREEWGVYLLGAERGVAEKVARHFSERYPGLKILGTHHGYFSAEEEPGLVEHISSLEPDILFVAMGSPRQERFIAENLNKLNVPVCMGVGGSFDVISGRVKRAPLWMQKIGLEWSYRLIREPRRSLRMLALPKFILLALLYRLGLKRNK